MEETTISTPETEVTTDTSANVEPEQTAEVQTDTSTVEPGDTQSTAETETETESQKQADTLYAGKYKSVEELEKGYNEAQKSVAKAAEFEKKFNELLAKQQEQEEKLQAQKLEYAQSKGFNTAEEAEIADRITLREYEYYATNLNRVQPEYIDSVRQDLIAYYQTGNKAYLDEAKRHYSPDFIEQVTLAKSNLEHKLRSELNIKQQAINEQNAQKLAESLKVDFADFLSDVSTNEGKSQALQVFCNADFINSKEDMKTFENIYSKIAKYEREQAIKEYEAAKTIEQTKQSAQIDTGANQAVLSEKPPTYEQVKKMTQDEFNAACDKWGLEKVISAP